MKTAVAINLSLLLALSSCSCRYGITIRPDTLTDELTIIMDDTISRKLAPEFIPKPKFDQQTQLYTYVVDSKFPLFRLTGNCKVMNVSDSVKNALTMSYLKIVRPDGEYLEFKNRQEVLDMLIGDAGFGPAGKVTITF